MNNLLLEIEQAATILHNVNHPRVKKLLAAYGYNAARFETGQSLLNQLRLLQQTKKEAYWSEGNMNRRLRADEQQIHHYFMEHRTLAKWVFRQDTSEYRRFELHQPIARRKAEKIAQIQSFYHQARQAPQALLRHGLSQEELEQAHSMIDAVVQSHKERMQQTGEARGATRERNKVRRALRTWVADFRAIARVALRDEPQLMEGLGMTMVG